MSGYETRTRSVRVGALEDLVLRSLSDLQQFDEGDLEASRACISSAAWPIFGHLWPSSRILAEHLATVDFAGRRVLELGCGLALPSLVMHRAGVDVTASDIHPEAARMLLANVALNLLAPLPFHRADWQGEDLALGRFGLLVGSDLLYERTHARALSGFIDRHAEPIAEVIVVDPNRGHRAEFRRLMADHAFGVTVVAAPTTEHDGVAFRGQILRFTRSP